MAEDKNINVEMNASVTPTEQEWVETNRKMRELYASVEDEFLRTRPLWMRLNLLANKVGNALSQGHTGADINWSKINKYLTENVDEYEFNCFDTIKCPDDLFEVRAECIGASVGMGIWQKHTCKDCGETFYMTFNEVEFFKNKELHVPKRCKKCRDKRKNGVKQG